MALEWCQRALKIKNKHYGENNIKSATTINNVGSVYA